MKQQEVTLRIVYDEDSIDPPHLWNWSEVIETDTQIPFVHVIDATPEMDYASEGPESQRQGLLDLN